jgi:biotin operon repressor
MARGRPKADGIEAQQIADRRMKVLALRRDGYTLAAIVDALEITPGRVNTDVKWLREQGYDLGEGHTGRAMPPPGADIAQLRPVATTDEEAAVRRKVNDRRIQGEDVLSIAIAMRIETHEVRRHIRDAARLAQEEDIEARRELELARLDRMLMFLDPGIQDGDPKSINAGRAVVAERCKLLGLYQPIRIEGTIITLDVIDAEMRRLAAKLVENGEIIDADVLKELPPGFHG